ncbi:MAG: hypothetical protein WCK08_04520 [Betaproteobacteria bacterium]
MKLIKAVCTLLAAQAVVPVLHAYAQAPGQMAPASSPWGQPVALVELAQHRGGASISRSEMMVSGSTAGNSASQVVTGNNSISAGSFANMSGLPLVVQNTGANVLIQNAVIINLQMQ